MVLGRRQRASYANRVILDPHVGPVVKVTLYREGSWRSDEKTLRLPMVRRCVAFHAQTIVFTLVFFKLSESSRSNVFLFLVLIVVRRPTQLSTNSNCPTEKH